MAKSGVTVKKTMSPDVPYVPQALCGLQSVRPGHADVEIDEVHGCKRVLGLEEQRFAGRESPDFHMNVVPLREAKERFFAERRMRRAVVTDEDVHPLLCSVLSPAPRNGRRLVHRFAHTVCLILHDIHFHTFPMKYVMKRVLLSRTDVAPGSRRAPQGGGPLRRHRRRSIYTL
jgi:hypothetical protein